MNDISNMGNDKFEIDNAPKEKKKNTWYIILIILLLVTNAIFIYLYFSSQNKFQTAVVEKERTLQETYQLKYELDSIMREYDKIKEEYGILNIKLSDQDSLIKEQAKEIEKLIASQADYTRIKRQLDRLRNITQSYVRQIDSLYRINQELTVENVKLQEDLTYEKTKAIELSTITDSLSKTISEATYMVAYNITPIAYK
ncbi:MAG: hypothetical protein PHT45_03850, partial [Bacteroidales bacterium]|nr:hypothetical protein [Bacteroidales bacterium]